VCVCVGGGGCVDITLLNNNQSS